MVKDNYLVCTLEQIRTFCIAWPVCINHHDKSVTADHLKCLGTVYKHIIRIAFFCSKCFQKRTYRTCRIIYYYLCLFVDAFCCAVYTDPGTERIYIRYAVSHDKDILACFYYLLQSLGFYPCFYTGFALYLLRLAAYIRYVIFVFDHNLISTSS